MSRTYEEIIEALPESVISSLAKYQVLLNPQQWVRLYTYALEKTTLAESNPIDINEINTGFALKSFVEVTNFMEENNIQLSVTNQELLIFQSNKDREPISEKMMDFLKKMD